MGYPISTIWAEYKIVSLREGGRIATESVLQQTMLSGAFSGKNEAYNKQLKKVQHGG